MGLEVAEITMNWLEAPTGAAHSFANSLVEGSDAWGPGIAFGFYSRDDLVSEARRYFESNPASPKERDQIRRWIEGLPFDDSDFVALYFSW